MVFHCFVGDRVAFGAEPPQGAAPVEVYRDFSGEESAVYDIPSGDLPPEVRLLTLRELFDAAGQETYGRAMQAFQILHWRRSYRFCPTCGRPLVRKSGPERAMRCEACGLDFFARINPAVIVAISWRGRLLLAERETPRGTIHGLVAGFVEPGESAEEAVRREVREEVGLELASLAYVTSQPWPFPSNLMLGFEAEAASGEIRPDGAEVKKAAWHAPDAMPAALPGRVSIARRLIERWRAAQAEGGAR